MKNTADVETITLGIHQYEFSQLVDWPFSEAPKFEVNYLEHLGKHMAHMIQRVAEQREVVAEYPADWWQALKERFAPTWARRRWPVLNKRIDMEVLYPKIALPKQVFCVTLHVYDTRKLYE